MNGDATLIGRRLGGYRLQALVAHGAGGTVYQARSARDALVAVKVLATADLGHGAAAAFLGAAAAAARAVHPNLVRLLDAGQTEDHLWLAMDWADGVPLARRLRDGPLPVPEAVAAARQVFAGLRCLHDRGLLHGDLRASRVLMRPHGNLQVLPPGLRPDTATPLVRDEVDLDRLGSLAPEQALGDVLGPPSDLYAGGILLYQMLTAHRPFTGPTAASLLFQLLNDEPPPPSAHAPLVPAPLDRLVTALLDKLPEGRPASAALVLEALAAAAHRHDLATLPSGPGDAEARRQAEDRHRAFRPAFVGRRGALQALVEAGRRLRQGRGGVIFVAGEAGVGKTRLLEEFAATHDMADQAWILRGAAHFDDPLGAYMPCLDALGGLFVGDRGLTAERAGLVERLADTLPELAELVRSPTTAAKIRTSFAATCGGDDGDDAGRLFFFQAVFDVLDAAARLRPVLLVLEDLHWSDGGTLELLRHLAARLEETPVLILASYRPEETEAVGRGIAALATQLVSGRGAQRLDLERLERADLAVLSRSLFPESDLLVDFDDFLFERSQGNPFIAVEVLKLLRGERILVCEGGLWHLRPGIHDLQVPERVGSLLRRRLDGLEGPTLELLQLAAVVGDGFTPDLLERASGVPRVELLRQLFRLERQHRVIVQRDGRYAFTHSLMRELLYRELPVELRREYHRLLASLLAEAGADPGAIGHHCDEGGDPAGAVPWLRAAGDEAWRLYSWHDAARIYDRLVQAAQGAGAEVDVILHGLLRGARACARRADCDEAGARLVRMRDVAARHDRPLDVAAAVHELGCVDLQQGRFEHAAQRFAEVTDLLAEHGGEAVRVPRARALTRWGAVDFERGDYDAARSRWQEARKQLGDGDGDDLANVLNNLAVLATMRGDVDTALDLYHRVLALDEVHGDGSRAALTLANIALLRADQGRWDDALELLDRGQSLCHRARFFLHEPLFELHRGEVCLGRGDLASARTHFDAALRGFRRLGDTLGAADALKWHGRLCREQRTWAEAAVYLQRSIEMNRQVGESVSLGEALYELGELQRLVGDVGAARPALEEAERIFARADARPDLERTRTALAALPAPAGA